MSINLNKNKRNSFFMSLALKQAYNSLGNTKSNPAVGCVVVKNNNLVSAGFTSLNGKPHAEYNALNINKKMLKNADIYITLEPCSHFGETPPCVNNIIKKKIKRVFFSINDPDLRSYKKCKKKLKNSGLIVNKGLLKNEISSFYKSYIKYKKKSLPHVTCKLAISKDYFTVNKTHKYITNYSSRARVHLMRSYYDSIITSSKTIAKDNSKLTSRVSGLENRSPARIIIDRNLKISKKSLIIQNAWKHQTIIFFNKANKKKILEMQKHKVKLFRVSADAKQFINLKDVLLKVKALGFSRVFLEAGLTLTKSFLKENLLDEFKLFISNKNLNKNGLASFKKIYNIFLIKQKKTLEKVNLYGETLITYNLK